MSTSSQKSVGTVALSGKEEYIRGYIFEAVDEERTLEGRGTLIMIFHPSDSEKTKTYDDVHDETKFLVPPGYKIKVIDAQIKMTK